MIVSDTVVMKKSNLSSFANSNSYPELIEIQWYQKFLIDREN